MIDEIFEIDEEFEEMEKMFGRLYQFPAVHIGKTNMYFNVLAQQLLPKRIKWIVTLNYIVGVPTSESDRNGYVVSTQIKRSNRYHSVAFPAQMRQDKKVLNGDYKVYKYKDGFCMKRNERIEENEIS